MKILVAITGASGIPLAIRLLEVLKENTIERHLIVSSHANVVAQYEDKKKYDWNALCEYQYKVGDIASNVASGSFSINYMVVVPCSMNTLAHIANGIEHNLITRSVAVNLKEERKVILVPRESPLSLLHIENMRKAKLAGCSIIPPTLAFYYNPQTIADVIDQIVGKILELCNIPHCLYPPWDKSN